MESDIEPDTYLGFAQVGGGEGVGDLRGPQGNPLQTKKKLFGFGPIFMGGVPFYERKIEAFYEESLTWGPTQIATGHPVTSKFEPQGLQKSPKGPFCSSFASHVAPGVHGIK